MTFDKKTYRANRELGLRGQGNTVKESSIDRYGNGNHVTTPSTKQVGKYALRKNTKRARKAVLNV